MRNDSQPSETTEHTFHSYMGTELSDVLDIVVIKNSNIPIELYALLEGSSYHNLMMLDLGDHADIHPDQNEILLTKLQWKFFRKNLD